MHIFCLLFHSYVDILWLIAYLICLYVVIYILALLISFVSLLYHYFLGYKLGFGVNTSSFGRWALITGCTDGIGKAYARALAKRHHNVILVSRNRAKLEQLSTELWNTFESETKIVVADFSRGYDVYDEIKNAIQGISVGILINNVGTATDPYFFNEIPEREHHLKEMINVNVVSCTMMISMILPEMERRGKGLILNLSSVGCIVPLPGIGIYGATKAYVDYLSRSLQIEYKKKGIIIQSVLPGYVSTNLSGKPASFTTPMPGKYVEAQLRTLGLRDWTYGYYVHSFTAAMLRFTLKFPSSVRNAILMRAINIRHP